MTGTIWTKHATFFSCRRHDSRASGSNFRQKPCLQYIQQIHFRVSPTARYGQVRIHRLNEWWHQTAADITWFTLHVIFLLICQICCIRTGLLSHNDLTSPRHVTTQNLLLRKLQNSLLSTGNLLDLEVLIEQFRHTSVHLKLPLCSSDQWRPVVLAIPHTTALFVCL